MNGIPRIAEQFTYPCDVVLDSRAADIEGATSLEFIADQQYGILGVVAKVGDFAHFVPWEKIATIRGGAK